MKENTNTTKLLTVRDVAELLQLSESSVYTMASAGVLPHLRVGNGRGTIRFRQEDIGQFLDSCQAGNVSQQPKQPPPTRPVHQPLKHLKLAGR